MSMKFSAIRKPSTLSLQQQTIQQAQAQEQASTSLLIQRPVPAILGGMFHRIQHVGSCGGCGGAV
jgi:hypothetical protein